MEVYGLQDNGIPLADSQAEMTPMQRFVYSLAKDHHTDEANVDTPSGMSKAHSATKGL